VWRRVIRKREKVIGGLHIHREIHNSSWETCSEMAALARCKSGGFSPLTSKGHPLNTYEGASEESVVSVDLSYLQERQER
jgi:hypothetical protein